MWLSRLTHNSFWKNSMVKWALGIVLIGTVVLIAWSFWLNWDVSSRRADLLVESDPTPEWIFQLGPSPEETASTTVIYGERTSDDPFWSAYGAVCAQLSGEAAHIALDEVDSRVVLSLNGYSVRKVNREWLIQGLRLIRGYVNASSAKNTLNGLNVCWRMTLEPGDYLVSLHVKQESGSDLRYDWAFRLTAE